jgi:anti-anti-sigma factor
MRPREFDIDVSDDGVLFIVAPSGEMDLATVPSVREALARCTEAHRALVLDLREVTFMDSTAVRLLIEMRNGDLAERFAVVPPPDPVGQVLDVSGVRSLFRWVGEPGDALG